MDVYDPKTLCEKCGHDSIRTEYHGISFEFEEEDGCGVVLCAYPKSDEHIVRTCNRCGYEFFQKPISLKATLEAMTKEA